MRYRAQGFIIFYRFLKFFWLGLYVASFWIDYNDKQKWFLANVVEICNSDSVLLLYLKKIGQSKEGEIWAYPEVPEVLKTNTFQ